MDNDISINSTTLSTTPKTKTNGRVRPAAAGAIGAIAGLIVGAVGIYGIIKMTEKPSVCPECNCPSPVSQASGLDYSFLKLETPDSNIIYSPLSIKNGLALLNAGANGKTKTEIENVLGNEEIPKYQDIQDKLSLANAVFIRDNFKEKVLPTYTENVQNNHSGEIFYDSFANTDNMDNWVKQKTFNLIDSIGIEVNPDLKMVLANALAIQMDWKHQFDAEDTFGKSFYLKDGSEVEATTMNIGANEEDVKYFIDASNKAVSLPLDSTSPDTNLEFIAIMPANNIDETIINLDRTEIDNVINNMTPTSEPKDGAIINIPKFKFDYSLNFKEDLQKLGINSAFNENSADFSNMASEGLYVGQAVHNANIDFSEEGIKAAAITVFAMKETSAIEDEVPQPVIINIDHPFLFLIRDANNGTIWFTGAVYQPNLWADDQAAYEESY